VSPARLLVAVNDGDHVVGSPSAPVVLVEYGDFECPHCGRAYPIIEKVRRELGRDLCFVFRHFPLTEIHPHAQMAAEAAEAAGAQRKFWEMHHTLFEHQDALEPEALASYADALGLNVARFATELTDGIHRKKVRDDFRGGVRSGVNGTPTFFINGIRFDGDWSDWRDFSSVLSRVARATGVAR